MSQARNTKNPSPVKLTAPVFFVNPFLVSTGSGDAKRALTSRFWFDTGGFENHTNWQIRIIFVK